MPNVEEGYSIIIDTIKGAKTHPHYDRVNYLADLYKKLITGDKIDQLLRQFVRREDPALFDQRKLLTQAITPSVSATIMNPFYKVGRVNSIIKKLDKIEDNQKKELEEVAAKYNGNKSLDRYLETRFVDLSFCDPNAFIITEFDNVPVGALGEMLEKVQPRPFEVSSKQAINFFYKNNILQWLIVKLDIKYIESGIIKDGHSYTIYLENEAIKFTQIGSTDASVNDGVLATTSYDDGTSATFYRLDSKTLFLVEVFEHKAGKVPAIRVGYKQDLVTNGETFVNPFHDAMPYFMKSIKTVSEFDLTMALHAFPQKFQYIKKCPEKGCTKGYAAEGVKCGVCHGTGEAIHSSAQDAVTMRMPSNPEEIIDLEKLVHYEYPPIALLEFQDVFIKELKAEALQAVFNSEVFSKTQVTQTATEANNKKDNTYDTLFPFAEKFSELYKYILKDIATFRDITNIEIEHRFPKDFKFKTVSELLNELNVATASSAPGYIRQELSMDIAEKQFVDKPEELQRIRTKLKFYPFPDKTPTEVAFIISNGLTSKFNKILWANFDQIFLEIEEEKKEFYNLEVSKQRALIKEKVDAILGQITVDEPQPSIEFRDTQEEPEDEAA